MYNRITGRGDAEKSIRTPVPDIISGPKRKWGPREQYQKRPDRPIGGRFRGRTRIEYIFFYNNCNKQPFVDIYFFVVVHLLYLYPVLPLLYTTGVLVRTRSR